MWVEIPMDLEMLGRALGLDGRREDSQGGTVTKEALLRHALDNASIRHCNKSCAAVVCTKCACTCLALLSPYLWGLSHDQHAAALNHLE